MKEVINKFIILFFIILLSCNKEKKINNIFNDSINLSRLEDWQHGFLDIHHINTGRGDATFFILPDGTKMLFDAGDLDKNKFEKNYAPLKVSSPKPNGSFTAAQSIALYIKNLFPTDTVKIDYGLVSHFHEDHYGSLVELANILAIHRIIDRGFPNYDFPVDLRKHLVNDNIFQEYISFIENNKITTESLRVGLDSQIKLLNNPQKYPSFKIKNVKSNATIWTGKEDETFKYFSAEEMTSFYNGKYNENPLSLAIKISYGDFDYFTGGDNTGLVGFGLPYWFDVETPMAKAIGEVEVTTLNHHGNRDATNEFFVKTLNPKVVVQQSWCSDHPGQEVYQRLIYKDKKMKDRDIFATNMHQETMVTYGPWFKNNYKSLHGHIVIRVYPDGKQFEVFVLNEDDSVLLVKEKYGPYHSK